MMVQQKAPRVRSGGRYGTLMPVWGKEQASAPGVAPGETQLFLSRPMMPQRMLPGETERGAAKNAEQGAGDRAGVSFWSASDRSWGGARGSAAGHTGWESESTADGSAGEANVSSGCESEAPAK